MKRILIVLLVILAAATTVAAFSTQWFTQFDGATGDAPNLPDWSEYYIGACAGQRHKLTGSSTLHMLADHGTPCFGAYYRDNSAFPGTFPTDRDVRVTWKYRYDTLAWLGTEAGQVTGQNGSPQYYGLSGVNNGAVNYYHVEANGSFGQWNVNNPLWKNSMVGVPHTATFDFICDGQQLDWWVDVTNINAVTNGTPLPPGDAARPYQFWAGNLLTSGGANRDWTSFRLDYVYVYAVERPQLLTPSAGSGGTQTVSWNPVPNTPQPDGSTWGLQYQARVCRDAVCATVVATSPWQAGTSYTFTNLPLNRTYYYQARAKWIGAPPLTTCWGNTASVLMPGNPALTLAKSAPATAQPGQSIHYSLTVQNTGSGPADGVTVSDPVPQYILNPTNISNGGSLAGNQITWNLGTLAPGASMTLGWDGTVDAAIPLSTAQIVNTAGANDMAGHSVNASATTAINQPGLTLSKVVDGAACYPGGTLGFTLTAQNSGNTTLSGVSVSDPIPNSITNPANISAGGTLSGNQIVWNLGTLAPGATQTLSWQGTVAANASGQIVNTAAASDAGGLTVSASDSCTISTATLSLTKLAPQKAAPGDTLHYTLPVRNTGSAPALNVTVRDPVPQYILNPANISNGGSLQGSDIVWTLNSIPAGGTASLTWDGTLDAAAPANVTAVLNTASACDGNHACANASANTELFDADVAFTKGATPYGTPGWDVTYKLAVTNTSQVPLTNVVVRDPLPAEIFYPRNISNGGQAVAYPFTGKIEITWALGTLAPGLTVNLAWVGTIKTDVADSVFAVRNVANLTSDEGLYREAESSTYLLHQGLQLNKQASAIAGPGETVAYTLTVRNPTVASLTGLVVSDPIPRYILTPTAVSGVGQIDVQAQTIRWDFGPGYTLPPGQSRTLTWRGTLDPHLPATETEIANTATATDETKHTAEATAHTTLHRQSLRLVKDATPLAAPGSVISYTLSVENNGAADLYGLDVRDPLPGGIVSPQITDGLGTVEGNLTAVWQIDRLAAGSTATLTWQGTLDPAFSGTTLRNTATANTAGGLSATADAVTIIRQPFITLRKQATRSAGPGERVHYTLLLENLSGAPATDIVVSDPIPDGIVNASNLSAGGELRAEAVRWQLAALAPGETRTLAWQGTVDPAINPARTEIVNTASAVFARRAIEATAHTNLPAQKLTLYKTATYLISPGGAITYALHLENRGQTVFSDTVIRDPVPAGVLFPTNISAGGRLEGNTTIVWRWPTLAPGQTADVSWQGMVDPAASTPALNNTATAVTAGGLRAEATAQSFLLPPQPTLYKQATLSAGAGETVVYTLTVGNAGLAPAFGLVVDDPIPAGIVNAGNLSAGGELRADRVRWQLDTLAPGDVQVFTWQGTVDPHLSPDVAAIVNAATLADAGGRTADAAAVTHIRPPQLRLRLLAPYTVVPGMPLTYTLLVENIGAADIYDIEVRDTPAPDTSPPPAFISDNGYLEGNTTLVWALDYLPAGVTRVLAWRGTVAPDIAAATLANHATATAANGLTTAGEVVSFVQKPRLTLAKSATPSALPGETVVYTLTLANDGDVPAFNVMLTDPVPDGVIAPTAISGGGTLQAGNIVGQFDTLSAGETRTVSWRGTLDPQLAPAVRAVKNIATVTAAGHVTADARAATFIPLRKITLTKLAPSGTNPGDKITYTLIAQNAGEATLRGLRLVDTLPQYLTPLTITGGGYAVPGEIVWDTLPDLSPGQQLAVSWQGEVAPDIPAGTVITNTADIVSADEIGATAAVSTALLEPALSLRKSAPAAVSAGGVLTYTLTLANRGPGLARDVTLRDPLPAGLTFVDADAYGTETGGVVTWRFDRLPAGESRTVHLRAQVALDTPPGAAITNTATLASPDLSAPLSATAVSRVSLPALSARLACPATAQAGDSLPYQLTVANPGAGPLRHLLARLTPDGATVPRSGFVNAFPDGEDYYWQLGTLPAGQTDRLAFVLAVDPAATGVVSQTVRLQAGRGFTATASCTTQLRTPVLTLSQSVPAEVDLHQAYPVELTVNNAGPVTAHHTVLSDTLPLAAEVRPGSATDGGAFADGVIRWHIGELPPGGSVTRRFTLEPLIPQNVPAGVQLYDPAGRVILFNTATATADRADAVHSDATTRAVRPRLTLEKTMPAQALPGDTLTVTLTARVDDALAQGVTLADTLPEGVAILPDTLTAGGAYDPAARTVRWALGDVASGTTLIRRFAVVVPISLPPDGQRLVNTAILQSPDSAPAYARAETAITGTLSLAALKQMSPTALPGGPLAVSIAVRNLGQNILGNVIIRDPLPAYTAYLSGSATLPPQVAGNTLTWNLGALAGGELREVRFTLRVADSVPDTLTRLVNRAEISFYGGQTTAQAVTLLPVTHVPPADEPRPTATPTASPSAGPPPTAPAPVVLIPTVMPSPTAAPPATPQPPAVLLPVTGGLLDPRTRGGKIAWGGILLGSLGLWGGILLIRKQRRRS